MRVLLIVLLILLLFGGVPTTYGYRSGPYGYYPVGGVGLLVLVLIVLLLAGVV